MPHSPEGMVQLCQRVRPDVSCYCPAGSMMCRVMVQVGVVCRVMSCLMCVCTYVYLFYFSPRTQGTPYRGSWGKIRINSKTAYVYDVRVMYVRKV